VTASRTAGLNRPCSATDSLSPCGGLRAGSELVRLASAERHENHDGNDDIRRWLGPDERLEAAARARDVALAVSNRRLVIVERDRLALDVSFERIRRVQFDIERDRPATLVIVPEHPEDEPQVPPIPKEEYRAVADALVAIGVKLFQTEPTRD
jgi:hypothetical protein